MERDLQNQVMKQAISKGSPMVTVRSTDALDAASSAARRRYNLILLTVAGLGGLLYGIDVGIIGGALPYLEATSGFTASQLSVIVAAVLLGSVFSTFFSGLLADWMGRRPLMVLSGLAFASSIPIIALSHGYWPLFLGRLLQGVSGGLVGVVVPLYLAECLSAQVRGKGTAIFQWMLTLGIFVAALVGIYFSYRVRAVEQIADAATLLHFKDQAWRRIFWVSLPPGVVFVLGALLVTESPRWLFHHGRREQALAALLRSRTPHQAVLELEEMETISQASATARSARVRDSLLRRKYVIPFLLACVILFCNTATGINSIIGYNTGILIQSGLSDLAAHWGYVLFTLINFLATSIGMALVDRKGRRFLLILGTGGVLVSLIGVGMLFRSTERLTVDCRAAVQQLVANYDSLTLRFSPAEAQQLLATQGYADSAIDNSHASLAVIYSCGDYTAATSSVRSDDSAAAAIQISRANCLPANRVEAFLQNPFGNLKTSQSASLKIDKAILGQIPRNHHGWHVALGLYLFMSFYAMGPGVVVWLALSELMPTRIRSNGMSIALVINQLVSTTLAGIFLPFVARYGYSSMFFLFACFTVIYFLVAVFLLPETKGKTLEEIEAHFEGRAEPQAHQ
jgi:MFS transporter, SP family, solute carrier family 2 (myo-inositol transporter), member 13